jgi:hypothetical protein
MITLMELVIIKFHYTHISLHSLITSVCNHNMGIYTSNNDYDDNDYNNNNKNKKKPCWDK